MWSPEWEKSCHKDIRCYERKANTVHCLAGSCHSILSQLEKCKEALLPGVFAIYYGYLDMSFGGEIKRAWGAQSDVEQVNGETTIGHTSAKKTKLMYGFVALVWSQMPVRWHI